MKFLEEVAKIFACREDLPRICFVFPNKRAARFFRRYLGIAAGRPVFSPRLMTINDLFADMSQLQLLGKIELLDILYKSYLSVTTLKEGEEAESFDRFICWGDVLLSDFDDIDKYLVDPSRLFCNLKDLKDLSVDTDFMTKGQKEAIAEFCHNFNPEQISDDPADKKRMFVQTWDSLLPLYESFRATLQEKGRAYEGMIYRDVAEDLRKPGKDPLQQFRQKYSEIVFVGLNALNECEKELLKAIRQDGSGDFYWDYFGGMVTDPDNRAGKFIRENVVEFPSRHPLKSVEREHEQHFEIISVPSAVGQTRVASRLISELYEKGEITDFLDTAVVLPDENLLFPMLNAIPQNVGKVNVTMGYPLSASSVSDFFRIIERLQTNARERKGKICFYHRDVIDMLDHPYFENSVEAGLGKEIRKAVVDQNRILVEEEQLRGHGDVPAAIFRHVASPDDMADYFTSVIHAVARAQSDIEQEFLYHYQKAVLSLGSLDLDFKSMERKTFFKLLQQYVSLISIPYKGEPLSGLQIMGPLETRALDFSNVIMLSVGEGVFPSKNVSASFIPYNLRLGFGLPTYELQDSIWAYHFYRSIYRAKNIYLLYDSRTEGLQSGEESRYIKQLRFHYEVPAVYRTATYSLATGMQPADILSVRKDEKVIRELEERFVEGPGVFSASSLNCYQDCPLKFYYKHVKCFEEEKEVVEGLDASLFGTVFHKTMQVLYEPFVGRKVTAADLRAIRKDRQRIEKVVTDSFRDEARINEISGRNIILKNLIVRYAERILEIDEDMAPFSLLGTEKKASLDWTLPSSGRKVRLFGFIDRLDSKVDGIVRVVDYKTGSVDKKDSIAFQMYFYSMLLTYGKGGDPSRQYDECIYSLRSVFDGMPGTQTIARDSLLEYKDRVASLIEDIFDPSKPFEGRPEDDKVCEYCDFKRLCGK